MVWSEQFSGWVAEERIEGIDGGEEDEGEGWKDGLRRTGTASEGWVGDRLRRQMLFR
jgi:hypothetical protein